MLPRIWPGATLGRDMISHRADAGTGGHVAGNEWVGGMLGEAWDGMR